MFERKGSYFGIERFERFEYTNNLVYEFFKRTLTNNKSIEEYEHKPVIEYTLKLKDVILFENDTIKFTLQDIIYNAFPKLYLDVMNDEKIKDKVNFSVDIEDFLREYKENDFKKTIYKDLNLNEYIELTYENLIKRIDETFLYKKINMRYQRKQLNIEESNFINIYDLNINLPDEEILDYILKIKRKYKKEELEKINSQNIKEKIELKEISEEEKKKIQRFILFKEKNKIKNKKRKLQYEEEPLIEYRDFLKSDFLKKEYKKPIDNELILKEFKNFKELEKLDLEKSEQKRNKKNLKYRSYIYNPHKLADILFVYDCMENEKNKGINYTYNNKMLRIQYLILFYRREYIEIIEEEDLKSCSLSEDDCIKILKLIDDLHKSFNFIPDSWTGFNKNDFSEIDEENITEMNEIMNQINSLMNEKSKKLFLPYVPFVSIRTLYKYYEIANFYIKDENYKLLLA